VKIKALIVEKGNGFILLFYGFFEGFLALQIPIT
jgi:hypothetical protein